MFKWIKTHGCNCCPLEKGTEKYILNVGDVWGGIVQSHVYKHSDEVYWESIYTVCGNEVSSQSGGPWGRDENMASIEKRIIDALIQVEHARENPVRRIFDALWEKDPVTGEFSQEELQ